MCVTTQILENSFLFIYFLFIFSNFCPFIEMAPHSRDIPRPFLFKKNGFCLGGDGSTQFFRFSSGGE
jgi:hypothetical protein